MASLLLHVTPFLLLSTALALPGSAPRSPGEDVDALLSLNATVEVTLGPAYQNALYFTNWYVGLCCMWKTLGLTVPGASTPPTFNLNSFQLTGSPASCMRLPTLPLTEQCKYGTIPPVTSLN